ncbi:MAG TPA: hypothetical protein VFX15_02725 [Actinomycetes bacterium]|nr:hypothetical protein [Actinomycetes bacterium]
MTDETYGDFLCPVCEDRFPDVFKDTHMQLHEDASTLTRDDKILLFWMFMACAGAIFGALVGRVL